MRTSIISLLLVSVAALKKCVDEDGDILGTHEILNHPEDEFCSKFCSKYSHRLIQGICALEVWGAFCYREIKLQGPGNHTKVKFCRPSECAECLKFIKMAGSCYCGSDCFESWITPILYYDQELRGCSNSTIDQVADDLLY
ncbi:hypothetical protein CONCODRAFT_17069 [Conidiobolus coronatus NRRL 28638]|uniref:Uncharacterized protein n=1 Tax=Conidiobolus coronatus (strain ATCC 28846 / CBS 209.66 / NRRL 28638) TaxID=796925 RepID=A0A137P8H6_CONC2|nr:hypothetical protein CONCODRAFT_17069 [Conidiobolus coronatus NRRL 28638]|eukprot:KXN71231.1 hypothetical protein CONCODRAFT_17069 [Conidiobolus coronatus NRRL 28638]